MIDLKLYRADKQKYIDGANNKRVSVDRDAVDRLDDAIRALKLECDELAARRNQLSAEVQQLQKSGADFSAQVTEVKTIKETMTAKESELADLQTQFDRIVATIPNPAFPEVIVGKDDSENQVAWYVGEKKEFSFTPKPHREIMEAKGWLDAERAVKMSGSRFVMVKGKAAQLEFALIQRAIEKLTNKGFTFVIVPQLVREQAMYTTGFLPNDASNLYRVNPKSTTEQSDREEDDLWLIGTSEVPLVSQHIDEVFDADQLPIRYCGFSSCYRREAWTYGKDAKGLVRVHQFEKVEMVSFVKPEDSVKEHELIHSIEIELFTELGLHFQRINICTGDLGAPAAKKRDLEAWFPGIGAYKEVTSTSNTTDFQTRRWNIKFKDGDRREFVHSLNGTALALGRALACLIETYQTEQGDVIIPEVLRKWMGVEKI
jgi:seryl-tRNA synthetase